MAEPVVFISRFQVKQGKVDEFATMFAEVVRSLEIGKPRTTAQVAYIDGSGGLSIVHVFPDADAMDIHFEGADERSRAAMRLMDPRGWEVYGPASESAVAMLRNLADANGVAVHLQPGYLGGFVRHAAPA
jgi:hypothetical protein